jgi:hypothetical protein
MTSDRFFSSLSVWMMKEREWAGEGAGAFI